jgi:hypothetical protein
VAPVATVGPSAGTAAAVGTDDGTGLGGWAAGMGGGAL